MLYAPGPAKAGVIPKGGIIGAAVISRLLFFKENYSNRLVEELRMSSSGRG